MSSTQQDAIFTAEQAHLSQVHAQLRNQEAQLTEELRVISEEAAKDIASMRGELFLGMADDSQKLETLAEYELLNHVIDGYNVSADSARENLRRTQVLLENPYFAKVSLRFKPGAAPRDIYIGTCGATDKDGRHYIVDWRSPVAEVYYNQANGPTSYEANGRTITCDLLVRRQFECRRDVLKSCFDTTVAIQDQLLLDSLAKRRSDKMTDITSTIQREQNQVIRHADVPVLLVNGIAGSGKTSVLLQRIAYLFYKHRDTLDPSDVCLITPNKVFGRYIDSVLPNMGERNPRISTFDELMEDLVKSARGEDVQVTPEDLERIDAALATLTLEPKDFCDIRIGNWKAVPASLVSTVARDFRSIKPGPGFVFRMNEELTDRLKARVKSLVKAESTQAEILDLPEEEQRRLFGQRVFPQTDEEFASLAEIYLKDRYKPVFEAINDARWLRIDRIGGRILSAGKGGSGTDASARSGGAGKPSPAGAPARSGGLTRTEWVYLKLALTGESQHDTRFVFVDEVQDYSEAQLMMLARYFNNAHFLLLGDENQAIKPGTASFDQIKRLFQRLRGQVEEYSLLTSYRSSPEITALFSSLLDEASRIRISSVQRPGIQPTIEEFLPAGAIAEDGATTATRSTVSGSAAVACSTVAGSAAEQSVGQDASTSAENDAGQDASTSAENAGYRQRLVELIQAAKSREGLTAVICANRKQAKRVAAILGDDCPTVVSAGDTLPKSGVLLTHLALAKGLEFDQVIIADAQAVNFPDNVISRRRLYTAISRATQEVHILSNGPMTSLLARE
ncbi:MAG: AAA family ATPase [Eggerthellales bacterium]|nr:AAA family ATPase [Eggerthellales bacterium]